MKIPEGYNTVMPYLIVTDAAAFKKFMESTFDAKEKMVVMRDNTDIIMHGEVTVGQSTIMFAQVTEEFKQAHAGMFIWVENSDITYQKALDLGSTSIMPPANQDYGRSCGVKDPFGNTWWITSPIN